MSRGSPYGTKTVREAASILGFWSALLATAFTIVFVVLALAFAPVVVILMTCIHYVIPENKKVFSFIGIAFSSVYAAIICTNYYIQLFVVRLNLINGTLEGLALLAMPNLHSAFFALETIGYSFLSLATLVGQAFTGGKLESGYDGRSS
jgi:hypothetical protein